MKYRIAFDDRKNILDDLPTIKAKSPKQAAEKYTSGKVIRDINNMGGIVVYSKTPPIRSYVYSRCTA